MRRWELGRIVVWSQSFAQSCPARWVEGFARRTMRKPCSTLVRRESSLAHRSFKPPPSQRTQRLFIFQTQLTWPSPAACTSGSAASDLFSELTHAVGESLFTAGELSPRS